MMFILQRKKNLFLISHAIDQNSGAFVYWCHLLQEKEINHSDTICEEA